MGHFKNIVRGDTWLVTLQPTQYPIPIQSSAGSPIVLALQNVHSLTTGDKVNVMNHRGNSGVLTNNGNFLATVVSANSISLQGSTSNGSGLNTGVVAKCMDGTGYTVLCQITKSDSSITSPIATPVFAWIDQTIFRFTLSLTATATKALVAGTYRISVRWVINGEPFTFILPEDIIVIETPTSV